MGSTLPKISVVIHKSSPLALWPGTEGMTHSTCTALWRTEFWVFINSVNKGIINNEGWALRKACGNLFWITRDTGVGFCETVCSVPFSIFTSLFWHCLQRKNSNALPIIAVISSSLPLHCLPDMAPALLSCDWHLGLTKAWAQHKAAELSTCPDTYLIMWSLASEFTGCWLFPVCYNLL